MKSKSYTNRKSVIVHNLHLKDRFQISKPAGSLTPHSTLMTAIELLCAENLPSSKVQKLILLESHTLSTRAASLSQARSGCGLQDPPAYSSLGVACMLCTHTRDNGLEMDTSHAAHTDSCTYASSGGVGVGGGR